MEQVKVLYVEDEPFLGKIVKESLESRNFLVQMEENGGTAFRAYQQFQPDICVLDVMLPGKDGFTIGQEIRSIDPTTPIIFLTARNQTEDVLKGFKVGGNDYLKKPFSMEELIVRIHNLLQLSHRCQKWGPPTIMCMIVVKKPKRLVCVMVMWYKIETVCLPPLTEGFPWNRDDVSV